MKKAKVILLVTSLMTLVGGLFAFKAVSNRYGATQLWTFTTLTIVNGRTYTAIDEFCAPTLCWATNVGGVLGPALYTTGPATGKITVTATNNTATTTIPAFDCRATVTRCTTIF